MKITDALVAEHRTFLVLFAFIEESIPSLNSLAEAQLLGRLLERLLHTHAEAEENLIFVSLDHVLEENGEHERFYQEHKEIDHRLKKVQTADTLAKASDLLKKAMAASRKHFKHEEKTTFVAAQKAMQPETLVKLGVALLQQRASSES